MSLCRILAVSGGYLHRLICFWTALNHSSTDLSPCLKLVSKSNRALTSLDCGLQKSSNLVHNVAKVRALSVKPHDTTKSIPSSPDHAMSFLHCLVSDRVASSQSKMFSHFSFHFRTDDTSHHWQSNPSWDLQCLVQIAAVGLGGLKSEHQPVIAPLVRWIDRFFYFVLPLCITSVGLWTTWSQVKIHTVYTYLV